MSVLGATLDDRGSGARGRRAAVPTWRAASPYGATWYFVQREGAVALLATDGPLVAEGDLKTIAASLAVRSPRFLLGG
ncbi:hypothetical protein [Kitasatospora sp. NPDC058218]|uniref:hypothetical protein n=1 Tax=Kitasatospora sp. NPDC058218 TaxID=3346385 RepID=UPI0036DD7EE7